LYPEGYGFINTTTGVVTKGPRLDITLELAVSVMADVGRNLYILHGFTGDTEQGIQIFNSLTGDTVWKVDIEHSVDSVYYDSSLGDGRFFALDFSGILEVDIGTGALEVVLPFVPPFEDIEEDSTAYDPILHRITFINTSNPLLDTLSTVDVLTRRVVSNVPIRPKPGQQLAPMQWKPGNPSFVWAWADKKFSRINTATGELTTIIPTIYTPFDGLMTAADSTGTWLSFVGTDGKEHCFVVTLNVASTPWQVVAQPLISPDITMLPTALAYF